MYRFYLYHPDLKVPTKIYDPVGWDTLGKTLKRYTKWHGVFWEYTTKLQFVKDGKAIIHSLYEKYGIECEILLFIERLNDVTRKYERDFTGKLNLTTLEISTLYATCNIENTGFIQKVMNRSDVKVNVQSLTDLDGGVITPFASEFRTIELHSKTINKVFQGGGTLETVDYIPQAFETHYTVFSLDVTISEIEEYFGYSLQITNGNPVSDKKYLFKVREGGEYLFVMDINQSLRLPVLTGDTFVFKLVYGKPGSYATIVLSTQTAAFDSGAYNYVVTLSNYTNSINLEADDEIYIYGEFFPRGIVTTLATVTLYNYDNTLGPFFPRSFVKITGKTSESPSNAQSVLIHEAWSRVVHAITGQTDSLRSTYYGRTDSAPYAYSTDGPGSLRAILGGFNVRTFSLADRPMNISLNDLIDSCMAIDGVGLGVEVINGKQYVVVEDLTYFYKPVEIMKLNYVKDIVKEVADDQYINELEVGYKKWANEQFNNLDEFASKRSYSLPITQIKNKLSLISPFIASGYTLEFTRRERNQPTKDNENDNENFIVQLRRSGGSLVTDKNEDFTTLTNVIDPATIYNGKLSITRNIIRNGRTIRVGLEKYKDKSLRLTVAEGNKSMVSRLSSESSDVSEAVDIPIQSLAKPLWLPERYKFNAVLTRDQLLMLNTQPYGYISFSSTDKDHKRMWIMEAPRKPDSNEVNFIGLRANV